MSGPAEAVVNPEGPEIIRLADLAQLRDLREEWLRLMARIPKTSYFQTPDWVLAWWETIGGMPATELALWRSSSGSLEGIQFLSHILRRVHSRLPPAWPIWTVTGSGVGDADHIGWPVLPEYQETARTYAMRRTRGSTLLLPDLDPETGVPFVPPGARMLFRNPCPRVALYRPDAIPASMRRTQHHLRRYEKRADAAGITFRWIPSSQMDDAFVERFLELHKLRMAEKGVSSRFLSTEALLRRLIAHGSAERGPIAMVAEQNHHMVGLLCFLRWGDTLAFYQSGWSPELASVEIGKLLFNESIKDAGADGMRTLDLLRGNEEYKYRLGAVDRWDETWIRPGGMSGPFLNLFVPAYRFAARRMWTGAPSKAS
ncbi:MAG: GNAT family N-acetyltransferase [Methanobacteriota archaeon]|nr:MAG: GNAT family N-acetyltransferase [Euryarchaeota archaeon]